MEQSVRRAGQYRQGRMDTMLPGNQLTGAQSLSVDFDSLNKGNYQVHTDADANFPESWTARKNTFMTLLQAAEKNPTGFAGELMKNSANKAYGKYMLGLSELQVEDEVSRVKQLDEINVLLKAEPVPNPAFQQAQQQSQVAQMQGQQAPPPDPNVPQEVSSVQVDKDYDVHAVELQVVSDWINSKAGQKSKIANPRSFENVRLHGLEHKGFIAQPPLVPKETVQVTLPLDKMPPEVSAEILKKLGIDQATPQAFNDMAAKEHAADVLKSAAKTATGVKAEQAAGQPQVPPTQMVQ